MGRYALITYGWRYALITWGYALITWGYALITWGSIL